MIKNFSFLILSFVKSYYQKHYIHIWLHNVSFIMKKSNINNENKILKVSEKYNQKRQHFYNISSSKNEIISKIHTRQNWTKRLKYSERVIK